MAVFVAGRILLDTNVFIDYLHLGRHASWVWGGRPSRIRFLSAVVLLELRVGADTARRGRAVDQIQAAFPAERVVAPTPGLFDRAGGLFRVLHGNAAGLQDRLGPMNDLLIALTAWRIGAAVVTANHREFSRIAAHLPGLTVVEPTEER
ncbi:MAG: type II toxin-antitoxin system VapC family toxin [Candidatus Rokubacteria bacterium]|nr:type II toxin-antitoxin system VapC family toxin [Candidatus Rokubacteria bacterium]